MITIPDEKIKDVMQGVIDTFLIPAFIALGMNASGNWIRSLKAHAENGTGYIRGMDYTYYLVNGRSPGKRPPIQPLIEWVGYKFGLYGSEAKNAAFAIATKIEREGTEYYPNGTQLLEILQAQDVQQYIYTEIGAYMNGEVKAQIIRQLKTTFT